MNSNSTYLELRPAEIWQSRADPAAMFAAVGARTSARVQRSWQQRAATIIGVAVLEIVLAVALIHSGVVTVPKLPQALTMVILPQEDLVIKAPPPTMPEIPVPIVPIQPVTIEVASDTAITVPPQPQQAAAPVQKTGGGMSAVLSYQAAMLRQIDAAKRYPSAARAQQRQGVAVVQFTMDRTGHVLGASLAKSSRTAILDEEAVDAVKRAAPFMAPPAEFAGDPLTLMVAVEFTLR